MPVEAGVELVAAVSEAGGLGVLSAAGRTPDELRKTVAAIRARTNKPFAIHLEMPANSLNSQELDAAKMLAEGLAPLFESLGLPNPSSAKGAEIYDFSGERRCAHFEAVFERVLERPSSRAMLAEISLRTLTRAAISSSIFVSRF